MVFFSDTVYYINSPKKTEFFNSVFRSHYGSIVMSMGVLLVTTIPLGKGMVA